MFDKLIESVKNFLPNLLWIALAALVVAIIGSVVAGGFDVNAIVKAVVTAVVAAFLTCLVVSALDNATAD